MIIDHLSNSGILVLTVNIDEIDDNQMADYLVKTFEETKNMTVICNNNCIQRIASVVSVTNLTEKKKFEDAKRVIKSLLQYNGQSKRKRSKGQTVIHKALKIEQQKNN